MTFGRRTGAHALVTLAIAALTGCLAVAGCGARYGSAPRSDPLPPLPEARVTRHVMLVSIDGLRADAVDAFPAPVLRRLMLEGSFSRSASTITPSRTLPSHTSMLTGELPERHRVLWNSLLSAQAEGVVLPTVFGVARAHGYRTAAFFSKSKFHALQLPGTLDFSQAPRGWFGQWSSERTARDVETHLAEARPNLLFVHLTDPDRAGHGHGWMSVEYGRAVLRSDAALGRLLAAGDRAFGVGQYSVIVTADHGGHGFDHGGGDAHDLAIPWIAWGHGVRAGELAGSTIRTIDTASTVLWLLGVPEPTDWPGTPVAGAFLSAASE